MDVTPFTPLLRFADFAARPDAQLDLAEGALMMADVVREALGASAAGLRRPRLLRQRVTATRMLETLRCVCRRYSELDAVFQSTGDSALLSAGGSNRA